MRREHVSFVRLQEKGFIEVYFSGGMWRAATVGENNKAIHFCAPTKEHLLQLISFRFPTAAIVEQSPTKTKESPATLRDIFVRGSLPERQYARKFLFSNFPDDALANYMRAVIIKKLEKPASLHAEALRIKLDKLDYADVTHEELVKHIHHLPTRSQLIIELGERNTFDFSN